MSVLARAELLLQAKNYSGSGDWLDESGNGHNATLQGSPSVTQAGTDSYWDLNGTDQYFTIADAPDLNFNAESMTVMARYYIDDATDFAGLVSKWPFGAGWELFHESNSGVRGKVDDGAVALDDKSGVSSATIYVGAFRYDHTAGELEAFLDGVGSGSPTSVTAGDMSNATAVELAARPVGNNLLAGRLYAVVLWREALTDAEIAQAGEELLSLPPDAPAHRRRRKYLLRTRGRAR